GGFGQIGDLAFLAHHNARHDGLDVTIAGEPFLPKNLSHKFFDFFNKMGGFQSFAAIASEFGCQSGSSDSSLSIF
ncbi:MAG: hypothetical protein ABJH45_01055, partial [Paracoccaceae bacterium]|uniref:hypothetical protein n=1 Tax=Shimia thalassica TaxID=1715693 RepID=UPI0032967DED